MKNKQEILIKNFEKNKKFLLGILILISLFELFMIVRGIIVFDFTNIDHKLYFIAYIVSLVFTMLNLLIVILRFYKGQKQIKIYFFALVYVTIIFIFSVVVSILDMKNGLSPIVFLTVAIAIPFFCQVDPKFYSFLTFLGIVALLVGDYKNGVDVFSNGLLVNIIVYGSITVFVTFKNYNSICSEYKMQEKLRQLSETDQLTAVYNRRALDNKIHQIIDERIYETIVMVDMNNFKNINDNFGHHKGDECLQYLARLMKDAFGENKIYRFGGDEFAIITSFAMKEIIEKLSKINRDLEKKFSDFVASLSAGIYQIQKKDTFMEIFIKVDKALYQAKKSTTDLFIIYAD